MRQLGPLLLMAVLACGDKEETEGDGDDGTGSEDGAPWMDGTDGTGGDGTGTDGTGGDGADGGSVADEDGDGVPDREDCAPTDPTASVERAFLAFYNTDRATVEPSALLEYGADDAFTLSWRAWYTSGSEATLHKGTNETAEYSIQNGGSSISLNQQAIGKVGQAEEPNLLGRWAHYTVVYENRGATFYLNGVFSGSESLRALGPGRLSELTLGNHEDGSDPLNGKLAEVVVWSEPRTESEVQDFVSGVSRASDLGGLVGHWPMDEGSGPLAQDASGNGLHATLVGADWDHGCL